MINPASRMGYICSRGFVRCRSNHIKAVNSPLCIVVIAPACELRVSMYVLILIVRISIIMKHSCQNECAVTYG